MKVLRIVANIASAQGAAVDAFYRDVLGLDVLMDHGWIKTFGNDVKMTVQVSVAAHAGSATDVPALSIEVDDLDAALARMRSADIAIVYGPVAEPWGVRRFYVRDPAGTLVNILQHLA